MTTSTPGRGATTGEDGPTAAPAVGGEQHRAVAVDAPWWRSAVIYQVYPRSFADADGDGVGDLPGIASRIDHLVDLGVDALWLSPFYPSPHVDAGYDVSDYRDVDPVFGTLADFDALLRRAHDAGLRVIIDLVPNHTSDEHPWFRAALAAGPGTPERDRYVFRDGLGPDGSAPPNDWTSVFGGPAWTRVTEPDGRAGQWYLHLFDVRQPDLSWDSQQVRAEFADVLRFWLDRGVDGFRVDVAHGLVKALAPPTGSGTPQPPAPAAADGSRPPIWDQDGVHEIYQHWRKILDGYPGERILVAEAWVHPLERLARYVRPDEMHQAFNFEYLLTGWDPGQLREVIARSLATVDSVGAPTTWVLSNHDVVRHATRFGYPRGYAVPHGIGPDDPQPDAALGLRRARAATLLMLALPGAAYLYQGEELGLPEDTTLPDDARQDPTWLRSDHSIRGRDGCRVPIPWTSDAPSYGFGPSERSWLPQPAVFAGYALDRQRGVPGSTYEMYRAALRLRREQALGSGSLDWWEAAGPDCVGFVNRGVLVVANLGPVPVPLPPGTTVLLSSTGGDSADELAPDTTVWLALDPPAAR